MAKGWLKADATGATGGRARRWTASLIVVNIALTLVLLAGAGFMMRSFLVLYQRDLGVDTSRMMTMQLSLPERKYATIDQKTAFIHRIDERLAAIDTLDAATTASNWPGGGGFGRQLAIEGRSKPDERPPIVTMLSVGARYFETLGIRVVRGRAFEDIDGTPGHEAAIVNQRFATVHFPGDDPIGKRIRLTEETPVGPDPGWLTIVGITPNVRQRGPQDPQDASPDPVAYIPQAGNRYQQPPLNVTLLVRTHAEPAKVTPLLREEIRALDPDIPLFNIRTMEQNLAQQRWPLRVFGSMFSVFAFIALVLSAVGLYAITAYSVTQRTQEIGVRMALGAQAPQVVWLFLRRAFVQISIGLTIGMAGAFGVGTLLKSLLVGTSSHDPVTLVSIAAVLIVVAVGACYLPARRATRLDPLVALRYE